MKLILEAITPFEQLIYRSRYAGSELIYDYVTSLNVQEPVYIN